MFIETSIHKIKHIKSYTDMVYAYFIRVLKKTKQTEYIYICSGLPGKNKLILLRFSEKEAYEFMTFIPTCGLH